MLRRKYPRRYGLIRIISVRLGSIVLDAARTPFRLIMSPWVDDRAVYALEPATRIILHLTEIVGITYEMMKPMNRKHGRAFKGINSAGLGKTLTNA